jgi:hypothetical protein
MYSFSSNQSNINNNYAVSGSGPLPPYSSIAASTPSSASSTVPLSSYSSNTSYLPSPSHGFSSNISSPQPATITSFGSTTYSANTNSNSPFPLSSISNAQASSIGTPAKTMEQYRREWLEKKKKLAQLRKDRYQKPKVPVFPDFNDSLAPVPETPLDFLLSMGFSREVAQNALNTTNNNLEAAAALLIEGNQEREREQDLPPPQPRQYPLPQQQYLPQQQPQLQQYPQQFPLPQQPFLLQQQLLQQPLAQQPLQQPFAQPLQQQPFAQPLQQQPFAQPEKKPQTEPDEIPEQMLCVICLESSRNTVFIPCGHLVSCSSCAESIVAKTCCPVCRVDIQSAHRIYFS